MITTEELLALKSRLGCLVPKPGVDMPSCHEKTLCDCEVLALIEEVERLESVAYHAKDKAWQMECDKIEMQRRLKYSEEDFQRTRDHFNKLNAAYVKLEIELQRANEEIVRLQKGWDDTERTLDTWMEKEKGRSIENGSLKAELRRANEEIARLRVENDYIHGNFAKLQDDLQRTRELLGEVLAVPKATVCEIALLGRIRDALEGR